MPNHDKPGEGGVVSWYAAFIGVAIVASIVGGFLGLVGAVAIKVLF